MAQSSAVVESVEVPNTVRQKLLHSVNDERGGISKRRLARNIGISEPTFYKIIGKKGARVSPQTMKLLKGFAEGEEKEETPQKPSSASFAEGSVMQQHFNRRDTAVKVLNAVSAILQSKDMDESAKIFTAQRIIGQDSL